MRVAGRPPTSSDRRPSMSRGTYGRVCIGPGYRFPASFATVLRHDSMPLSGRRSLLAIASAIWRVILRVYAPRTRGWGLGAGRDVTPKGLRDRRNAVLPDARAAAHRRVGRWPARRHRGRRDRQDAGHRGARSVSARDATGPEAGADPGPDLQRQGHQGAPGSTRSGARGRRRSSPDRLELPQLLPSDPVGVSGGSQHARQPRRPRRHRPVPAAA